MTQMAKKRVHFLHIGKTGGTAIKSVLNNDIIKADIDIKLHNHNISIKDVPKGEKIIFFLRDPISRFISGFYSRQRKGQPRYYYEWNKREREVFETFDTPNEVACALADSESVLYPTAVKAMKGVKHFKPYSDWYVNFDYFESRLDDVLFVGFQETLDEDFDRLLDVLGVSEPISLPDDDIGAHRNPDGLDRSLDEAGVRALERWYRDDIAFVARCKRLMADRGGHHWDR